MTRDQELSLITDYQQTGNPKALDTLVKANMGFIWRLVRRYNSTAPFEDRVQEGVLGLIVAIRKFKTSSNVKLVTYAGHWVAFYLRRQANQEREQTLNHTNIIPASAGQTEDPGYNLDAKRRISKLTSREHAVIKQRILGRTHKEIGTDFNVTKQAVQLTEANVCRKWKQLD